MKVEIIFKKPRSENEENFASAVSEFKGRRMCLSESGDSFLIFGDNGGEDDFKLMWEAITALLLNESFISSVKSFTCHSDDGIREDLLSQIWKVRRNESNKKRLKSAASFKK